MVNYEIINTTIIIRLKGRQTTEEFSVVQKEGKRNVRRKIKFYNLDAIIAVGYRVNSYNPENTVRKFKQNI